MDLNRLRLDFGITLQDSRLGVIYSQSISINAGLGLVSGNLVQNGAFQQCQVTNIGVRNQAFGVGIVKPAQLLWKKQDMQRKSYTGPQTIETWPARQHQFSRSHMGDWMKQKKVTYKAKIEKLEQKGK